MIVDTAITKARDQTTVLIGEDTDLLVLLLYHAEMDAKSCSSDQSHASEI